MTQPTVRVIVTGGRDRVPTDAEIAEALKDLPGDTVIVHGGAKGVDRTVAAWADRHGFKVERRDADWKHCSTACPKDPAHRKKGQYGSYCPWAGHRRNVDMAQSGADLVIAFPGNRGTTHMISVANSFEIPVLPVVEMAHR